MNCVLSFSNMANSKTGGDGKNILFLNLTQRLRRKLF